MKNGRIFSLLISFFLLTTSLCHAQTRIKEATDQSDIKNLAYLEVETELNHFITNWVTKTSQEKNIRIEFEIGKLDPRLIRTSCHLPLSIGFQSDPLRLSSSTIKIKCNDQAPWQLFVSMKANYFKNVLVSSHLIPRGSSIQPADLMTKEVNLNQLRFGYYANTKAVVGMIAKRSIRPHTAIQPTQLKAPKVINKGDEVIILANTAVFQIKMKGKALADGNLGQQIPIKNMTSKRIVRGVVIAKGSVEVLL